MAKVLPMEDIADFEEEEDELDMASKHKVNLINFNYLK